MKATVLQHSAVLPCNSATPLPSSALRPGSHTLSALLDAGLSTDHRRLTQRLLEWCTALLSGTPPPVWLSLPLQASLTHSQQAFAAAASHLPSAALGPALVRALHQLVGVQGWAGSTAKTAADTLCGQLMLLCPQPWGPRGALKFYSRALERAGFLVPAGSPEPVVLPAPDPSILLARGFSPTEVAYALLMWTGGFRGSDLRHLLALTPVGATLRAKMGPTKTGGFELVILQPQPAHLEWLRLHPPSIPALRQLKGGRLTRRLLPAGATVRTWRKAKAQRAFDEGGLPAAQTALRHRAVTSTLHYLLGH